MMIRETTVFGEKERFAIEIAPTTSASKYYLRLWLDGTEIGDFKKGGSLDYIVKSYFKLNRDLDNLYEEKFNQMNERAVFDDILYDLSISRPADEEQSLYARLQKYGFEFGDNQLNDFTFLMLNCNAQQNIWLLIYEMDGKNVPRLRSFKVETNFFLAVYREFVHHVYRNDLMKNLSFFPKGFSVDDIQ